MSIKKIVYKQNKLMLNVLPVYKLTNFPVGHQQYKPYTTALIALLPEGLRVVMRAYEVHTDSSSTLCCVLKSGDFEKNLTYNFGKNSTTHGEDLQGIYWGFEIQLDRESSKLLCKDNTLECGFFKWGNSPKHSASLSQNYSGKLGSESLALEQFTILS